jgi:pimeloyl-ACP methyl ester carboxylesterase
MPVLVIGGGQDLVTGSGSLEELASEIPHSKLIVFPELGHGAFEETREFNLGVLKFLVG